MNNEKNNESEKKPSDANGKMPQMSGQGNGNFDNMRKNSNIPDGYEIRQITVGVSNGTMIEVVSGISEGETGRFP